MACSGVWQPNVRASMKRLAVGGPSAESRNIPFVPRRVFRRIPTRYIASAATLGSQRNVSPPGGLPPPLLICIKAGALLQP